MKLLALLCVVLLEVFTASSYPEERIQREAQLADVPPEERQTPQEAEEKPEDEAFALFGQGRNTFFPIIFNGYHSVKTRQVESGEQGNFGSLAIANSFSTGKSGASNSQATSFPYGSSPMRSRRSAQNEDLVPPEPSAEVGFTRSSKGLDLPQESLPGNTFFPITFNGYGASARQGLGGSQGYFGSTTSIANSLATGKSGIANSHAMAFGDPNAAALFKRTRRSPQVQDAEEDDGSYGFEPSFRSSRGNTFFPITFNGYQGAGARQSEGGPSGYNSGTTAIANSFATGRSGVANSRATAFGDPAAAALFFKNGGNQQ